MKDPWINACCWTNEPYLTGKIRAVTVTFHGLGGGIRTDATPLEIALGEAGILVVAPYCGPWSWMNRNTRRFADELLAAVYAELKFDDRMPLIAHGGSMGGCAALLYCRYGRRKPIGCVALYPVCDVVYHFHERPDLPTSFHHAFYGYPEPWDEVLREHSPLHQEAFLPDIPYLFIHGFADDRVSKAAHSDRLTAALRERAFQVEYLEVPGMGHGRNIPLAVEQRQFDFITGLL